MRLCVYCASSSTVDEIYKQTAAETGRFCAAGGIELVYGGGHVGLMGILADAALEGGGQVIGVIPEFLEKKEVGHQGLTQMIETRTMQERQAKMAELSDAFLVLPGGLGTLAEFFEILTWKQLFLHDKPIYIWNRNNYWNALLDVINTARDQGFLRQQPEELFHVIADLSEIKL